MCGIVGAVAQRDIVPILIEGLRRLEYRGYDSCGVATVVNGQARRERSMSRVADLDAHVRSAGLTGSTGIAHTRWATHGAPATCNAHPIFSRDEIALVHNGIIENHETLRKQLVDEHYEFDGQTDTEVVAHLIHSKYRGDLLAAVRDATSQLHGAYAIAVFSKHEPQRLIGARAGSPLVVGVKDGECYLASDALALAGITDRFIFLEEGDIVELTPGGVRVLDRSGAPIERAIQTVSSAQGVVELGPYRHFMQKEIFEQPQAVAATIPCGAVTVEHGSNLALASAASAPFSGAGASFAPVAGRYPPLDKGQPWRTRTRRSATSMTAMKLTLRQRPALSRYLSLTIVRSKSCSRSLKKPPTRTSMPSTRSLGAPAKN